MSGSTQPLFNILKHNNSLIKLGDKIRPWKEVPKFLTCEKVSKPYKAQFDARLPPSTVNKVNGEIIRITSQLSHWTEVNEAKQNEIANKRVHSESYPDTANDTINRIRNGSSINEINGKKDNDSECAKYVCRTDIEFSGLSMVTLTDANINENKYNNGSNLSENKNEFEFTSPKEGSCYLILGHIMSPNQFFASNNFIQSDLVSVIGLDCIQYASKKKHDEQFINTVLANNHKKNGIKKHSGKHKNSDNNTNDSSTSDVSSDGTNSSNGNGSTDSNELLLYTNDDLAVMSYVALYSLKFNNGSVKDVYKTMNLLERINSNNNNNKLSLNSIIDLNNNLTLNEFSKFIINNNDVNIHIMNENEIERLFTNWKIFQMEFETNQIESWFVDY